MSAKELLLCFSVLAVSAGCGDREETKAAGQNEPPPPFADSTAQRQTFTPQSMGLPSNSVAPPGTVGDGSTAAKVSVTIKDHKLTLSQTEIPAGPVTFKFTNSDDEKHIIELSYEHGGRWRSVPVGKGGFVEMGQSMTPGPYKAYCYVPGHKERGEETSFTVK